MQSSRIFFFGVLCLALFSCSDPRILEAAENQAEEQVELSGDPEVLFQDAAIPEPASNGEKSPSPEKKADRLQLKKPELFADPNADSHEPSSGAVIVDPSAETKKPQSPPVSAPKKGKAEKTAAIVDADISVAEEPAPYDPIKENGEYFLNWPAPKFVLVFTGFQEGYLEPCGCAGMQKMKGGLSRRYSFFGSLREKGWPVIAIDGGDFCSDYGGKQAELKFHLTAEALRKMDYDVIGLGREDLRFSVDELLSLTVNIPGVESRFTAANIAPVQFDPSMVAPYRIVERAGVRVGVASILTSGLLDEIDNPEIAKADPVKKLREILPELEKEECDYLVLIAHGKKGQVFEETQEVLKSFPEKFGVVLLSDPPAEPPLLAPKRIGGRYYIEVGEKGKFAVVLGIFEDSVRYQPIALDSRYANSPIIMDMMQDYQDQLRLLGPKGLGAKSFVNPKTESMGKFIGSKECQSCHEPSYEIWKDSGHARAWKTLTDISKPARNYDPECVACHAVGWNPVEKYAYLDGYDIAEGNKTKHLTNVGCESCHGPGEKHKAAEMGNDKTNQAELRLAVRLPLENAQKNCVQCHDGDNSPAFQFDTYWEKIKHSEDE